MKFFIDNIFFIAIALVAGGALLWPSLTQRGKRASAQEVTRMMNAGKTLVLDVRDSAEYATGHLPNAKHIALGELDNRIGELDKFKRQNVVVVCQSGARASSAAGKLLKAGFTEVVSLDGGVAAWKTAGLPLSK